MLGQFSIGHNRKVSLDLNSAFTLGAPGDLLPYLNQHTLMEEEKNA
jgi:hypothetical protein